MLDVRSIHITFNPGTPIENKALRGVSLQIPEGQFVTVIGSNGAGKSTLLNAVSGDLSADSGQILIDDIDVTRTPVWRRARHVARVFQDPMAGTCEDLRWKRTWRWQTAAACCAIWHAPSSLRDAMTTVSVWPRWAWDSKVA